jgi:hypothetical protein
MLDGLHCTSGASDLAQEILKVLVGAAESARKK